MYICFPTPSGFFKTKTKIKSEKISDKIQENEVSLLMVFPIKYFPGKKKKKKKKKNEKKKKKK